MASPKLATQVNVRIRSAADGVRIAAATVQGWRVVGIKPAGPVELGADMANRVQSASPARSEAVVQTPPCRSFQGWFRFVPCLGFAGYALLLCAGPLHAAGPGDDASRRGSVAAWVAENRAGILDELSSFLALPNVAANVDDIRANAAHLQKLLEKRGIETRLLESPTRPYVFGRLLPDGVDGAARPLCVLFYTHFDGQPVDPSRWTVTAPFTPKLPGEASDPDARLYARSASDDKGPIVALLAAIDALRATGIPPNVEAKFIFDPEEEIGSPSLEAVLQQHAQLLAADLLIFADGPVHQSGRPTLVFGNRGIVTVTLTVYGPARPLHSGHYGNWVPNPAEKLSRLLASMKDAAGRVLVQGFYDDVVPLSAAERAALRAIPAVEPELQKELGIALPDAVGATLQEAINQPSLNVRGLGSGSVGAVARTIVPSTATAEIDMRLVNNITPAAQVERLHAHVRAQGYEVVADEPDVAMLGAHARVARLTTGHGTPATRTSMDTPMSVAVITAVRRAVATELVLMPMLGGTGPMHAFETALRLPVYGVPIVNHDNNQHSDDENLRLGNLWDGIVIYASLLRLPPPAGETGGDAKVGERR